MTKCLKTKKMRDSIDISILVVSYNTCEMTLAAISSALRETTKYTIELVVVDNASTDGSPNAIAAAFPDVKLIRSKRNLGFGAANNLASAHAHGDRILLLNPDTVVMDAAIDRLQDFADENPDARIWGGRTFFEDGRLNPASCWRRMTIWNQFCRTSGLTGLFPAKDFFNGETFGGWQRDTVEYVDIVSGCFLLIDRTLWRDLNGFAPVFFMYGEEADLCLRAAAKGARPLITPDAAIIHIGGASETVRADKVVRLLAAKSELIERHMTGWQRTATRTLLHLWPLTRWVAGKLAAIIKPSDKLKDQTEAWADVIRRKPEWQNGFTETAGKTGDGHTMPPGQLAQVNP
ncbi:MAG: glycosyltransferase family 2 protein [Pseudomonadota bacterium]